MNWKWTIALGLTLPACGYSTNSLVRDTCECEGCSEEQENDLRDELEDEARRADNAGCSSQWGDLLSCEGEEFECNESRVDIDGCESELESYSNCMD